MIALALLLLAQVQEPLPPGAVARMGTTRFRHASDVPSLAFSPDGASLATVSSDGTLRLWAYPAGTPRWKAWADTTTNAPTRVLFAPDGRTLATTGYDGSVRLWDAATGRQTLEIPPRRDVYDPAGLAFSPDSKLIAAAWPDTQIIELYDAATGRRKDAINLDAFAGPLRFSPDGGTLASAGEDTVIALIDPATGKVRRELEGHDEFVSAIAFSRDGATLVSGSADKTVRVWEPATGRLRLTLKGHTKPVWSVAIAPDGRTIASSGEDDVIRLWDAATGKELRAVASERLGDGDIAFTPDGATLAVPSADHAPLFYDVATGERRLAVEAHDGGIRALALSPDGKTLATASGDRTARLWDAATGRPLFQLTGHAGHVDAVAFVSDGRLITGGQDKALRVWDAATGKAAGTIDGYEGLTSALAVSPDRRLLVASFGDSGNHGMRILRVSDASSGKQLFQVQARAGYVRGSVAFSSDGATIVAASGDRGAAVWSATKEGGALQTFDHPQPALCVAASPDGRTVACGTSRQIIFWDRGSGQQLMFVSSHGGQVASLAYAPDGRSLASAGADGVVRVWETLTGREVIRLRGHTAAVTAVAFTKDGARIVSASDDTTVLVWDAGPAVDDSRGLEEAWEDLAGDDARRAWRAIARFAGGGDRAVALAADKLRQTPVISEATRKLIAELEDEDVVARDRATQELKKLGAGAEAALRRAAEEAPPGESRARIVALLDPLEREPVACPEVLRRARAIQALERIGTAEARALLARLAEGASTLQSRLAKASLERLKK